MERIFLLYQYTLQLSPLYLPTCSSKHTRHKTCLKGFKIYWPLTMTKWSIFFHCQESGLVNSSWLIFSPIFGVGGKFEVWKHSNPRWNQTYPNQAWTTHWVCISPSHATTLIADWTPWKGLCLWYFLINLWNKYIPSFFLDRKAQLRNAVQNQRNGTVTTNVVKYPLSKWWRKPSAKRLSSLLIVS